MKVQKIQLKWKLQDIPVLLKNSLSAILKGEFLLRLNIGRYFIHIIYAFFLLAMVIWLSLVIETRMNVVEKNKAVLKELEIEYSQKTFEVEKLSRRSSVEKMLEEMGSKVREAEKPATVLEEK